jgi:hypothetical protein
VNLTHCLALRFVRLVAAGSNVIEFVRSEVGVLRLYVDNLNGNRKSSVPT